jgi:ATP-dependent DNA helicase RecG
MDLRESTKAELIEIIQQLLYEREEGRYEEAKSSNQNLTFQYATGYFVNRKMSFDDEQKFKLGLINEKNEYTNLALLMSDQCEHSVQCAIFSGEGKNTFRTRKEFSGSILRQLEGSYEYINLYNNTAEDSQGIDRTEEYDYPRVAIREALINALLHRDYNFSGSVLINMFTNRMEFVSIGGIAGGLTLSDIKQGISQTRKKALGNVFYRLKLVDSYGTGIQRILECYRGRVKPEFICEQATFMSVLPNVNLKPSDVKRKLTKEMITERQVLGLFEAKEMISRKDVEELLNCSGFPARKVLTSLIEKNKIQVVGNGRSTRYILV